MFTSSTRFAGTSVSAISRNLILLLSSTNDANEKDVEGETLRAATNRNFRMQCFTHTHTPALLGNHPEEKHSRRSSNIPLGVSVSVLSQWKNIRVITSYLSIEQTIQNCAVLKHVKWVFGSLWRNKLAWVTILAQGINNQIITWRHTQDLICSAWQHNVSCTTTT